MKNTEDQSFMYHLDSSTWTLLQLADSSFPSGGFAHSNGLESLYQAGVVTDQNSFHPALHEYMSQLMNTQMPYISSLHQHDFQFKLADEHCHTTLMNAIANRASKTQGKAFLSSSSRVFKNHKLSQTYQEALKGKHHLHFAPVYGLVTHTLDLTLQQATQLFLYINARDWTSAAVRLNILGPVAAQQILHQMNDQLDQFMLQAESLTLHDVYQTLPLFDITHGCHDRIYSKLFQS